MVSVPARGRTVSLHCALLLGKRQLVCCSLLETFAELHVGVKESEGD